MEKLRLNRLSTFGLLRHLKQEDVGSLIDALLELHCLRQVDVDRFRPVLELTEFGEEVMRGAAPLGGPLPVPGHLLIVLRGARRGPAADRPATPAPDCRAKCPVPSR